MNAFQNLSIGKKIACAVLILLFPIALLGYFLVVEKQELINFARQEIAGVHYLRAAHEVFAAATSPAASKDAYAKAAEALAKAEQEDNGALGVTQKTRDLIVMLKDSTEDKEADGLVGKVVELISTLSDNSNITLDPDGDTYFIGDIVVNQSAALLMHADELIQSVRAVDSDPSEDHKIAYAEARDGVIASAGSVATDLAKAVKNNTDGTLKQSLEEDGKVIAGLAAKLVETAQGSDRGALVAAAHKLNKDIYSFAAKNNDELERLLNVRIDGYYHVLETRIAIAAITVLLGLLIMGMIIRSITAPLSLVTGLMGRLTQGDLSIEVPRSDRRDEIGVLMRSLQAFHDSAIEREQAAKMEAQRSEADKLRAQKIQKITSDFESKVQGIVSTVAAASTELAHTAEEVTKVMERNSDNAKNAAASSVQTTSNVQSVASAAEEMSASVKEISAQVQRTNQLANDSRSKTIAADEKASVLSVAAHKVSEAVTLIANIADQINLLALNATIESARAGDAGKGFAVVASEVKNLANQTNKSVEDVGKVIQEVNSASAEIIEALRSIKESVENVSNASSNIAAAVEEQSATTNEITRNMHSAAQGTQVISDSLDSVSDSSVQASSAAGQVLSAAQELSRQSEDLNREVGEFLSSIRSA